MASSSQERTTQSESPSHPSLVPVHVSLTSIQHSHDIGVDLSRLDILLGGVDVLSLTYLRSGRTCFEGEGLIPYSKLFPSIDDQPPLLLQLILHRLPDQEPTLSEYEISTLFAEELLCAKEDEEALTLCTVTAAVYRVRWFEVGPLRLRLTISYGILIPSHEAAESSTHLLRGPVPQANWNMLSYCNICYATFGVGLLSSARHHCRSCGSSVCSDCAQTHLYLDLTSGPLRVCNTCVIRIESNSAALSVAVNPLLTWLYRRVAELRCGTGYVYSYTDVVFPASNRLQFSGLFIAQECKGFIYAGNFRVALINPQDENLIIPIASCPDRETLRRCLTLCELKAIEAATSTNVSSVRDFIAAQYDAVLRSESFLDIRPSGEATLLIAAQRGFFYSTAGVISAAGTSIVIPVLSFGFELTKLVFYHAPKAVCSGICSVFQRMNPRSSSGTRISRVV